MTDTASAPVIETGCCPPFDPAPWDGTEIEFDDRLFVKDRVRSILHIPINFGRVMVRNITKIDAADARDPEMLTLADEKSLWGSEVYISVSKEVPGAENVRLSGRYLSKVFEGPYKDMRKWMQQMRDHVAAQGKTIERTLFYYTTCPKCAKAYGKNYVVLLGEL
jgi:hypothetical protein